MPTPGFNLQDKLTHNEHGYRGPLIPMAKGDAFRILFLGGSTTYGGAVLNDQHTYPEQTKKALIGMLSDSSLPCFAAREIEIINAGIEGACSSDELNAYLYKFRYYRPDLVVLHSGGNDAEVDVNEPYFSPDHNNLRSPEFYQVYRHNIPPIFFRSWFFSFISIRFFLLEEFTFDQYQINTSKLAQTGWYDQEARKEFSDIASLKSPFAINFRTLLREIKSDSAAIVMLPFALNLKASYAANRSSYTNSVESYNGAMKSLSLEYGAIWVDYKYESIDSSFWLDDCHLLPEGEKQKGELVAKAIYDFIKTECP